MAKNTGINMPSGFGGLTRFNEEYESKFNLKPSHIVALIVAIIVLRISLKFLFPLG